MNFNHLRYFQTLAEVQHFSKAAAALYITQPTLSNAIAALESDLGVKLFQRNKQSLQLTEEGKIFLTYVNQAFSSLNKGRTAVNQAVNNLTGTISIASDRILTATTFIKVFQKHTDCSNVDIRLSQCHTSDIERDVIGGTYDIGFVASRPNTNLVDYFSVPDASPVLLVPINHWLASKDTVDLRTIDFEKETVIVRKSTTSRIIMQICDMYEKVGYDISKAKHNCRTSHVLATLVEAGFGIGITLPFDKLPYYAVKSVAISYPEYSGQSYVIRRKDNSNSQVVNTLLDFLRENFSNN